VNAAARRYREGTMRVLPSYTCELCDKTRLHITGARINYNP
jgi:hypothetical protein